MTEPKDQTSTGSVLDTALAHLRRGELPQAARLCEGLLARSPQSADALHLLGTVRSQERDIASAAELYERAAAHEPGNPIYAFSLGVALKELGRFEEALASLDRAVASDSSHALAHCVRGDVISALGRPADALECFDAALLLNPRLVDAHNNRGNELRALGRPDQALDAYDRVLAMVPGHPAATVNRGNALFELGRFADAIAAYEQAARLLPQLAQIHVKAGDALQALDRFDEALERQERALAIAPDMVQAVNGKAIALTALRRLDEAQSQARRAIELAPDYAPAHNTLGNALRELGHIEQAAQTFRTALGLAGNLAEVNLNLAQVLLLQGELGQEAWRAHEHRRRLALAPVTPPKVDAPEWQGEALAGKHILVWTEQGLGDTLQFCRLLRCLQDRGAKVSFLAPTKLVRILKPSLPGVELVTGPPFATVDFTIPLLSLPYHLGMTLPTIPAAVPYLAAEPDCVTQWGLRLGAGIKVGIAWQGNPNGRVDIGRSFALARLAPLGAVQGVRLISLQKGAGSEQLDAPPPGLAVERLAGFDDGPDAFVDTAAVMQNLDLVITSDTAVAHLAGALGRPVWVALQYVPDWRWLLSRDDTPWYPTMRLFRQPRRGDWDRVFADIAVALADWARDRQPPRPDPLVPVSWGELADKISILEIKFARLASPLQKANVARELAALAPVLDGLSAPPAGLAGLRAQLKAVNERLWQIEDDIRARDAAGAFDDAFIALARAVYATNDERGRLKRRINDLLGSNLIEEKQYHAHGSAETNPVR